LHPSADLYNLVHALTASEKRYVRRVASLSGRDTSWLVLFEAINAQTEFDDEELRARLKNDPMLGNLSLAKRYAYNNVMRALRMYGTGRDIDSHLADQVENYKVLQSKGLHDQAQGALKRLRSEALSNDAFLKVFWTIVCEFGAGVHSTERAAIDHLATFLAMQQDTLACMQNYSFTAGIYFKQRILLRHRPNARTTQEKAELADIVSPILDDPHPVLLSDTARTFYNLALGDYWEAMGFPEKALPYYNTFVHEEVLDLPIGPFDSLHLAKFTNAMFFRLRNNITEGLADIIACLHKRVGTLSPTSSLPTIQVWRYERWIVFSILLMNCEGRERDARALLANEQATLNRVMPQMSKKIALQFQIAQIRTLYGVGETREAAALAEEVVNTNDANAIETTIAMVGLLLIKYDLKAYDELELLLRSAKHHLDSRKHYHRSERAIVQGVGKLLRCTTKSERNNVRSKLAATLSVILADPAERTVCSAIDVLQWCEKEESL